MRADFALLFDMDGVIADTNPAHKETLRQFCDRHDKEVSEGFLREKVYGRTNKEWLPLIFEGASQEELQELAKEKEGMFRDYYRDKMKPLNGLISFLDRMKRAAVPMVVATSAPAANASFLLNGLKIAHYFKAVLNSSHVEKGKPEPEVYLKASAEAGCEPVHAIVLEDSRAGVQAGKNAGCKVIGVTTTHSAEELEHCDQVIDDFTQLQLSQLQQLFETE